MKKIEAYKNEYGDIVVSRDSFEMLLSCLDNQKFINNPVLNGDYLSTSKEDRYKTQREMQETIDFYNTSFRDILHDQYEVSVDKNQRSLRKKFAKTSQSYLPWTSFDLDKIQKHFTENLKRSLSTDYIDLRITEKDNQNNFRDWANEEIKKVQDILND